MTAEITDADLRAATRKIETIAKVLDPHLTNTNALTGCLLGIRLLTANAHSIGVEPGLDFYAFVRAMLELHARSVFSNGAQA